jgi:hypothetical protein
MNTDRLAALTQTPAAFAVVSTGMVAGEPTFVFGYADKKMDAKKASTYLRREHATFGEHIDVVEVATAGTLTAMPVERLTQVGLAA